MATSPDEDGSVEPARASASISVMPPVSGTGPGLRTSPMTKTRWLRYCSTATVTCGFLKYPSASLLLQFRLELPQRHATGGDATDERERKRAVRFDGVPAAEIRLVEDLDGEDVLRPDDVVAAGLRMIPADTTQATQTTAAAERTARAAEMYRLNFFIFWMVLEAIRHRGADSEPS